MHERHPDSILIDRATLLLANIKLGEGDPQAALRQLAKLDGTRLAKSSEYLFASAKANQLAGNRKLAQEMYTRLYIGDPTSSESDTGSGSDAADGNHSAVYGGRTHSSC